MLLRGPDGVIAQKTPGPPRHFLPTRMRAFIDSMDKQLSANEKRILAYGNAYAAAASNASLADIIGPCATLRILGARGLRSR